MAISIVMKFAGMKLIRNSIRKFELKLQKQKKLNTRIGIKALAEINKQFETDGSEFETKWTSLKPATVRARRSRGKGTKRGGRPKGLSKFGVTKVLRDTGTLRNSFTFNASEKKVIVGTATKYSKFHQNGTKHIKQRAILPLNRDVAYRKISKPVVEDYIKNERKKIFGK